MANGQPIGDLFESVLAALGRGVAEAQSELDRHSIAMQRSINEDPVLVENGVEATWYRMPQISIELSAAITIQEAARRGTTAAKKPPFLLVQPVNAYYVNQFNYDTKASSIVKLTMAAVPAAVSEAVPARLTAAEVLNVAIGTGVILTEPDGTTPRRDHRLAVNYSGRARSWFVTQYRYIGETVQRTALVVVDDATGQPTQTESG